MIARGLGAAVIVGVVVGSLAAAGRAQGKALPVPGDTAATMFNVGGLRVIHERRSTNDVVVAQLYLLGGARQITASNAGIEPLVVRTAQYGSGRYPGNVVQQALARTGSAISSSAENDWTVVSLRTIRSELDSAWAVFADGIMHPTLDPADLVRVRTRMLTELVDAESDPNELLRRIARKVGFAGHPYANDPAGADASLRNMTADAAKAYHATQFVTSRMLLVVVGNVDRSTIERLVTSTLAQLPAGNYTWTLPPEMPKRPMGMSIYPRKLASDYIIGIFPGPVANTKDFGPFRVGTSLLGAHMNRVIREDEHLAYAAATTMFDNAAPAGMVYVMTTTPELAMNLVIKQMESVANEGMPFEAIPWYVSQFSIETLMEKETNAGLASALARGQLIYGDFRQVDAPVLALNGVNDNQIRRVAAHYMTGIQLAFVGDTAHFRKFMR